MPRFVAPIIALGLLAALAGPAAAQRAPYDAQQRAYEQAMAQYQQDMLRYEKDKTEYDRRYGRGAYDRRFGMPQPPAPPPLRPKGQQPKGPAFIVDPGPPYLGSTCSRRAATDQAGLAAALAGSMGGRPALSSRSEGAVLGALIEGTLGANLTSPSSAQRYAPECDADGFYFTADQTFPYREAMQGVRRIRNGRYDEVTYIEQGCRLAVGAVALRGRVEYRYARVCPDRRGRLRFSD